MMKIAGLLALFVVPPLQASPQAPRVRELLGGSEQRVTWRGIVPEAADFNEWEVFLSLDGGRTYTHRLTPHLDREVEEATWTVPEIASSDARLLFRAGKEQKEERSYLFDARLIIRPRRFVPKPDLTVGCSDHIGERARRGDASVVVWFEGSRNGKWRKEVRRSSRPASFSTALTASIVWKTETADQRTDDHDSARAAEAVAPFVVARGEARDESVPFVRDILCLSDRLNI